MKLHMYENHVDDTLRLTNTAHWTLKIRSASSVLKKLYQENYKRKDFVWKIVHIEHLKLRGLYHNNSTLKTMYSKNHT